MGDAFGRGDDVVAGHFEPLVGDVEDGSGVVGFDVVLGVDGVAMGIG